VRLHHLARRLLHSTLVRFIAVGVLNTAFSYALYAGLVLSHIDYRLALTICSVVTIIWNFNTTGRLVFGNRRKALIFKFVGGYGLIYLVNLGLVIMLARFGVGELARQAVALPVIVACSFALNRGWVFRDHHHTKFKSPNPPGDRCNRPPPGGV
jgi:putative flippase GtrA